MDAKEKIEKIYESVASLPESDQNHLITTLVDMTKKRRESRLKELQSEQQALEKSNADLNKAIEKIHYKDSPIIERSAHG